MKINKSLTNNKNIMKEMTDEEFEEFLEDLDESEREESEEKRYRRSMEARLDRSSQFRRLYGEDLGF